MSSPMDFSGTEKPRQIQENLMAYLRLFAGLPGTTLYDAESFWFVSNTSAPGNMIVQTHFETSCIEKQIDATLEQISQSSDQIDWLIFPDDQPADLGKRLEERGMLGGPGGNWLWTDLTRLQAHPTMPDHFRVEQVRDFSDAFGVDSRLGGGLWFLPGALLPSLCAAWVWAGCLFVALHRVCG
jgi:hypothetical protein